MVLLHHIIHEKYTRHMGRDHTEIKHFTHIHEMINVTMSDMTSRMRVTILQIPIKHCVQCSAIFQIWTRWELKNFLGMLRIAQIWSLIFLMKTSIMQFKYKFWKQQNSLNLPLIHFCFKLLHCLHKWMHAQRLFIDDILWWCSLRMNES